MSDDSDKVVSQRSPHTTTASATTPRGGALGAQKQIPSNDAGRGESPQTRPPVHRLSWFWVAVAILLLLNWGAFVMARPASKTRVTVPFSPYFLSRLNAGDVKSITTTGNAIQGTFTTNVRYPVGDRHAPDTDLFSTQVPTFWDSAPLTRVLRAKGVQVNAQSTSSATPIWEDALLGFGPTVLLVLLFVLLARRASAGGGLGALGKFGRSQARKIDPDEIKVTFADVAGIDDAKTELEEIVDFLKHPDRYTRLGARIPRGVLLFGPPGTGKTLLARAVAGEASAAYFSVSASEFIEGIVGVGAARVRDLFATAKATSPAIIFIDELDAVGRSRNVAAISGADDEREQTLDQILTEMDGFDSTESVIVLGATNRPDVLDEALLRPGRFDRRVAVTAPDRAGRTKILAVHARSVHLAPSVDLDAVAALTPGMVGADLANLVNEAALLAARRSHELIDAHDFSDALEKVVLGTPRGIVLSPADRERTAYHESGHALVGMLTPEADPVRQISIVPRGLSLGVTLSTPTADRVSYSSDELLAQIKVALGGRVAEEIVYTHPTTGAESDLDHLTKIARQMVGRWGMSSQLGPVTVLPDDANGGSDASRGVSAHTLWIVDQEVREIVDRTHKEVTILLTEHRQQLDSLAMALVKEENLDADAAYAAAGFAASERPAPSRAELPIPVPAST